MHKKRRKLEFLETIKKIERVKGMMKNYDVTGMINLALSYSFTIRAKDDDDAERKAKKLIDDLSVNWDTSSAVDKKFEDLQIDEDSCDVSVDFVEEQQ